MMKNIFNQIWAMALPYQDQRDDPGHAEVALAFAQRLLRYEEGDRDVIIPAIILHDIGYSQIPKEKRMKIFERKAKRIDRLAVQYEHQIAGVLLARKILESVDYLPEKISEILEIISQHDTRKGFISQNEGLTRDADKLWRYSRRCLEAGEKRAQAARAAQPRNQNAAVTGIATKKKRPPDRWRQMKRDIMKPGYFYSARARNTALRELVARKKEAARKKLSEKSPVSEII